MRPALYLVGNYVTAVYPAFLALGYGMLVMSEEGFGKVGAEPLGKWAHEEGRNNGAHPKGDVKAKAC